MEQTPEHVKSEAIKYPAPYPESRKIVITKEERDHLVEKYGEEKVNSFYKLVYMASVSVKLKSPVVGNG